MRGILKKDTVFEPHKTQPEKGMLKNQSSLELKLELESQIQSEQGQSQLQVKSILKDTSKTESASLPQGILRTRTASEPGLVEQEIIATESTFTLSSHVSSRIQDSSTEDSESGERYTKIRNEAVLRRKMQRDTRKQER